MENKNTLPLFRLFGTGFCALLLALWPGKAQATPLINSNFDTGSAPGWSLTGDAAVTNTQFVSSPDSLGFNLTGGGGDAQYSVSPTIASSDSNTYELSYAIQFGSASMTGFIYFNDSTGSAFYLEPSGGSFIYTNGGTVASPTTASVGSYSANLWYNVTVDFNRVSGKYNLLITQGATTVASVLNIALPSGSTSGLHDVGIHDYSSAVPMYVDNVNLDIAPTPEPSVLSMVALGLLALTGWRRRSLLFLFAR